VGAVQRRPGLHRRPTTSPRKTPTSCGALQDLWWAEAARNNILPLDWRGPERMSAETDRQSRALPPGARMFVYDTPLGGRCLNMAAPEPQEQVVHGDRPRQKIPTSGAEGMIFTQGGFTGRLGASTSSRASSFGLHSHVALETLSRRVHRAGTNRQGHARDGFQIRRWRHGEGWHHHAFPPTARR